MMREKQRRRMEKMNKEDIVEEIREQIQKQK